LYVKLLKEAKAYFWAVAPMEREREWVFIYVYSLASGAKISIPRVRNVMLTG
jgi:hypothetical protein